MPNQIENQPRVECAISGAIDPTAAINFEGFLHAVNGCNYRKLETNPKKVELGWNSGPHYHCTHPGVIKNGLGSCPHKDKV